jgi:diaphanous 1
MTVPKLNAKLEGLILKEEFDYRLAKLEKDIAILRGACDEVFTNAKFKHVLEVLLALGNYLNAGTVRGGAYGFKLEVLKKIADVKSCTPPIITLMNYLVDYLVSITE